MELDKALAFLRRHQPMPPDKDLPEDLIEEYENVLLYLKAHPVSKAVPLLLNSFGDGDGFGVYDLVDEVIERFTVDEVVPYLCEALSSPHAGVRHRCAEIADLFPDERLLEPLLRLLREDNTEIRACAANTLEGMGGERVRNELIAAVVRETDPSTKSLLLEVCSNLTNDDDGDTPSE